MDVEKLLEKLDGLELCSRCKRDCCGQAPVTLADIKRVMPRARALRRQKKLKVMGARGKLIDAIFSRYLAAFSRPLALRRS